MCISELLMIYFLYSEWKNCFTVKPVLRDHLRDKEKVVFYDRWPLKRGSIYKFFYDRTRKR